MGKAEILEAVEDGKKLSVFKDIQPITLLQSDNLENTLATIRTEVTAEIHDVQTEDGRKNISSLGKKIAKSRGFVENEALNHARVLKSEAKEFDAKRKIFKDFMDGLKDETMQPLIEYEATQKKIEHDLLERVNALRAMPFGSLIDGLDTLEGATEFRANLVLIVIDDSFAHYKECADTAKAESLLIVNGLIAQYEAEITKEAEEQKERDRIIAQERAEYEAKVAKDAQEKAEKVAQEMIEAEKKRAEAMVLDRENTAKQQAIALENTRIEAEQRHAKELEDQRLADEKRVQEAEARGRAGVEAREAEIKAQADLKAKEQAAADKKAANKKHQAKINNAIVEAIVAKSFDYESGERALTRGQAVNVVTQIAKGEIPNLQINY